MKYSLKNSSFDPIGSRTIEDPSRRIKGAASFASSSSESIPNNSENRYIHTLAARSQQQQLSHAFQQQPSHQQQQHNQQHSLTPKGVRGPSFESSFNAQSRQYNQSQTASPSVSSLAGTRNALSISVSNPYTNTYKVQQSPHHQQHQTQFQQQQQPIQQPYMYTSHQQNRPSLNSNINPQSPSLNVNASTLNTSLSKIKGLRMEVRPSTTTAASTGNINSSSQAIRSPSNAASGFGLHSSSNAQQPSQSQQLQQQRYNQDLESQIKPKYYLSQRESGDISALQSQQYSLVSNSNNYLPLSHATNNNINNDSQGTPKSRFTNYRQSADSINHPVLKSATTTTTRNQSPNSISLLLAGAKQNPDAPSLYSQQYYQLQSQSASGFQAATSQLPQQQQQQKQSQIESVYVKQSEIDVNPSQQQQLVNHLNNRDMFEAQQYQPQPQIPPTLPNSIGFSKSTSLTIPTSQPPSQLNNPNPYSLRKFDKTPPKLRSLDNPKGLTIDSNLNYSNYILQSSQLPEHPKSTQAARTSLDPYNLNIFSSKSGSRSKDARYGHFEDVSSSSEWNRKSKTPKLTANSFATTTTITTGPKSPSYSISNHINSKGFLSPQSKPTGSISMFESNRNANPMTNGINPSSNSNSSDWQSMNQMHSSQVQTRMKPFQPVNENIQKPLSSNSISATNSSQPESAKSPTNKRSQNSSSSVISEQPTHQLLKQSLQLTSNSSPTIRRDKPSLSSHLQQQQPPLYTTSHIEIDKKQIPLHKIQISSQQQPDGNKQADLDNLVCDAANWAEFGRANSELIDRTIIPNHERTKFSIKRNGIVKSYAANTNQGLVRNYNEDRVSIILNITKPPHMNNPEEDQRPWPKCSFFGVYDGHGGVACADFLRDNLHQYVIKDTSFPHNPRLAIKNGFAAAEKAFLDAAEAKENDKERPGIEKSGSCAIVIMIVGTKCYVANVGDSRAIMSRDGGKQAYSLSRDHKPLDDIEVNRISLAGGKIYQTKIMNFQNQSNMSMAQPIFGPHRVLPGRLSVTRTFGDIEAKLPRLGGNPNVVVAIPDINEFEITDKLDFILLASDGIFDKLTTKETVESIWHEGKAKKQKVEYKNVHEFCGIAVDTTLKFALGRKTMDNITVVMIGFDNLKRNLFSASLREQPKTTPAISHEDQKNLNRSSDIHSNNNHQINSNNNINNPSSTKSMSKENEIRYFSSKAAPNIQQYNSAGQNNGGIQENDRMKGLIGQDYNNMINQQKVNGFQQKQNLQYLQENRSAFSGSDYRLTQKSYLKH